MDSYEEYAVEGSDTPIWLPKPTGYKAVSLMFDNSQAFNLDVDSVEAAWELIKDARTRDLDSIVVREPYFGEDNVLTREAMARIMWIAPIYINHEEIKANAEIAKQRQAAMESGLTVAQQPLPMTRRNGRRA